MEVFLELQQKPNVFLTATVKKMTRRGILKSQKNDQRGSFFVRFQQKKIMWLVVFGIFKKKIMRLFFFTYPPEAATTLVATKRSWNSTFFFSREPDVHASITSTKSVLRRGRSTLGGVRRGRESEGRRGRREGEGKEKGREKGEGRREGGRRKTATWVSGSPNLQLYSKVLGPLFVIITPKNSI
jgi:hypothetical protein